MLTARQLGKSPPKGSGMHGTPRCSSNFPKLRPSGRHSHTVRSLDEALGRRQQYLPPDAPRGPVDQLRTPELLEAQSRNSV